MKVICPFNCSESILEIVFILCYITYTQFLDMNSQMSVAILLGQFFMTVRQKIQVIKILFMRRSLPMQQPKTLTYQKATGAIRFKMVNDYMFRYILQKNQKV